MRHWLIDAGAIKTGGGVQIALNRLPILLDKLQAEGHKVSVLLPDTGPLSTLELRGATETLISPSNPIKRLFFENFQLYRWLKHADVTVIYTLFGFGLPHPKTVLSVVNTANATTCYPESPYWSRLKNLVLIRRKIYTKLRQNRLKKAGHWIFETDIMRKRSVKTLSLKESSTSTLWPSVTKYIKDMPAKNYSQITRFRLTLITGNEAHKNLDCLVAIAIYLLAHSAPIDIGITLTDEQLLPLLPEGLTPKDVSNIKCLGKIPQTELQSIYEDTDLVVNLAELESFSNNYMEAWKSGLAMICSDRDFSRHICRNSAIFVEPLDPELAAKKILGAINDRELLNRMASQGKSYLLELPSHELYAEKTLGIIKHLAQ
jgi:glycosyltransferase involved in cell wall biosynthesis